jgi:hypothetical protein
MERNARRLALHQTQVKDQFDHALGRNQCLA